MVQEGGPSSARSSETLSACPRLPLLLMETQPRAPFLLLFTAIHLFSFFSRYFFFSLSLVFGGLFPPRA